MRKCPIRILKMAPGLTIRLALVPMQVVRCLPPVCPEVFMVPRNLVLLPNLPSPLSLKVLPS